MQRASRLILNKKVSREIISDDDVVTAVWPSAVGKAIAAHTLRLKMVRSKLVVEVEDAIWQRQLYSLSGQILNRLRTLLIDGKVEDIEFRVGAPKRPTQRAVAVRNTPLLDNPRDEADSIQDPVLKKVYQLSRRKASA